MGASVDQSSQQSLANRLSSGETYSPDQSMELLLNLVSQVGALHAAGQVHLGICLEAIQTGVDGPQLSPVEPQCSLDLVRQLRNWTPTELRRLPRELPTDRSAAIKALESAGIACDPAEFDLLALGDVFCRLLTGRPAADYRQSVRVKGQVPPIWRPVLERMLGADGQTPFASATELQDAVRRLRTPQSAEHPVDPAITEALPIETFRTEGDTAVSQVGLGVNDTSLGPQTRSAPVNETDELPFRKLGHFEIQARIGHGGMGDVYRAYEPSLDRTVAIKVLPAEFARQPDFIRRFQAEATAAARLVHPNIIQIYFIGEDGGHHFFAMQYVDGPSLATLLEKKKKLPVNTAVALIEHVLHGLEEAHSRGFIHRDIKPGNILIDRAKQRALLADFGLVKQAETSKTGMTATGVILGTVDYISPEQARSKEVDGRSDLYSVGVLFYHLLSGRLPFVADSPTAMIFQHVYEQPPPLTEIAPDVPQPLADIIGKLMEKNPADRYQSARDVLTDLKTFRRGQPVAIAAAPKTSTDQTVIRPEALLASSMEVPPADPVAADDPIPAVAKTDWDRWWKRWRAKFEQHAPQALRELQNTQQQVDGALAIYETRRDDLQDALAEAQGVREELAADGLARCTRWNYLDPDSYGLL